MTTRTAAMHAMELPDATAGGAQWVHLFPAGRVTGIDGRGPYALRDAQSVAATCKAMLARRPIPVDYEHATERPKPAQAEVLAAGWLKDFEARADGLWGLIEWTPKAAKHIADREYRYVSPVVVHDGNGAVEAIASVALTNVPNLTSLKALFTAESAMDQLLSSLRKMFGLAPDADHAMIAGKLTAMMDGLRQALALPADAPAADMIAAAAKLRQSPQSAAAPDPAKFVPMDTFEKTVAALNRVSKGVSLMEAEQHVAANIKAMNMPPFLKDWGIDLCSTNKPAFDAFIDRSKGIFNRLGQPLLGGSPPTAFAAVSDTEKQVLARMGLREEDYRAANPAR